MTLARSSDPATSHLAAGSVNVTHHRATVLAAIRDFGPMTDENLCSLVHALRDVEQISPSGARTRRCELTRMGLVVDTGERKATASGRKAIVWAAAA